MIKLQELRKKQLRIQEEIEEIECEIVMKQLVSSWSNPENNTEVAQLFREIIIREGSMCNLRVGYLFQDCNNLTDNTHSSKWYSVFRKDNQFHYIRQEALDYYLSL